ncbi:MAG: S-adenosylmethionine decarboxylase [Pseudomonadales bacterium]|nr:S-adenosylmethionine decarboxylase [Pseudomonadales bacterium]
MNSPASAMPTTEYKRILVDGVHYYGKHLVLSARHCNDALLDVDAITRFLKELVVQIDMVAYGEPLVARFGQGIEEGISGVQLIETSAITVHTNDMARDLYLDVFSCKGYNELEVLSFIDSFFGTREVNYQVLLRK